MQSSLSRDPYYHNQRTEWNPPAGGSYSGRSPYSSKTWTGAGYSALGVALTLPDLGWEAHTQREARAPRNAGLPCRPPTGPGEGERRWGARHPALRPPPRSTFRSSPPCSPADKCTGGDRTFQNSTARARSFGENMLLTSVPSRALSRTNASTAIKPGMSHVRLLMVLFNVKS